MESDYRQYALASQQDNTHQVSHSTRHNYTCVPSDQITCPYNFSNMNNTEPAGDMEHMEHVMLKSKLNYIAEMIMVIAPPIILIVGTTCNALTVAVFTKTNNYMKVSTAQFLLNLLSITDALSLNIGVWAEWPKAIFRWIDIPNYMEANSDAGCKIYSYLYHTIVTFSIWILVVVTLERLMTTVRPLHSHTDCTRRRVVVLLILILAIILLLYMPVLMSYKSILVVDHNIRIGVNVTIAGCGSRVMTVFYVDSIARIILPFIIMTVANVIIIIDLCRAHKNRRLISNDVTFRRESKQLQLLTALLLSANCTHLICTIPNLLYVIPYILYSLGYYSHEDISHYAASQHLWFVLITCLVYIDQSVNFLFYIISGKLFRDKFMVMMGCYDSRRPSLDMYYMQPNTHEETCVKYNTKVVTNL